MDEIRIGCLLFSLRALSSVHDLWACAWSDHVVLPSLAGLQDHFDGFVVIHGTDTMAFTAAALSFLLENLGKPVVLTGSQIPLGEYGMLLSTRFPLYSANTLLLLFFV